MTILGSEGDTLDYLRAVDELDEPDRQLERFWQRSDRLDDYTPAAASNVTYMSEYRRRKVLPLHPYHVPPSAA